VPNHSNVLRSFLAVLVLAIGMPCLARAQDPFQSAPGPAAPRPSASPRISPHREPAPAAPEPGIAAPAPVNSDATFTRRAPSGFASKIRAEVGWTRDCAARPIDIRLVEPPRNGTITFRDETSWIPAKTDFGPETPACVGKMILGKSIYYQSNPGFHGTDRCVYLISFGGDPWKRYEVQINVE
jgi:hypothetical protein